MIYYFMTKHSLNSLLLYSENNKINKRKAKTNNSLTKNIKEKHLLSQRIETSALTHNRYLKSVFLFNEKIKQSTFCSFTVVYQ